MKEAGLLLQKYTILELRIIGNAVGVKCPTALQKAQLIDEIVAVLSKVKPPHAETRGRKQAGKRQIASCLLEQFRSDLLKMQ